MRKALVALSLLLSVLPHSLLARQRPIEGVHDKYIWNGTCRSPKTDRGARRKWSRDFTRQPEYKQIDRMAHCTGVRGV